MSPLASQKKVLEGHPPAQPWLPGLGSNLCLLPLKSTPCHLCPEPAVLCPRLGHQCPSWPQASVLPWGPPSQVLSGVCRRKSRPFGVSLSGLTSLTTSAPLLASGASANPPFPLLPPFQDSSKVQLRPPLRKSPQMPPSTLRGPGSRGSSSLAHLEAKCIRSWWAEPCRRV